MSGLGRAVRYAGVGLLVVTVLVGAGFVSGVLGVPTVDAVENRFADVDDSKTTVDTNLTVANPNPVGASLGNVSIAYAIAMNDVPMANGSTAGLAVDTGQSTIPLRTTIDNERIPEWWYTHVDAGETTEVGVDVDVSHSLLGGRSVAIQQEETIETDILGQFNDSTTRPMNADAPLVSDPILYLNETAATYGENVTRERTPLELAFTVYNPKPYPYAVSEIGYEIGMNEIQVGEGASERGYAIPPGATRTIEATVVIDNENLDDWWVSHLRRDQVTDLAVDVHVVVDPSDAGSIGQQVPAIRIDSDALDYETEIETDIFGTKASDGLPPENETAVGDGGADGSDSGSADDSGDGSDTATETETTTASDGDTETTTSGSQTETSETETSATETTATETDSGDGVLPLG